ncbi:MAG TPA: NAD(P)H-binding protein [Trebonia sp.]|nr:NAD(P)H-binding protein [Trebonia sp.]
MGTYLILGGTGKVGRRVVRILERDGHIARAAGRSGPVRFDWNDPGTWEPAVRGADGIFVVGPGSATDWSPLLTRLLETAAGAGAGRSVPPRAVLLSARGVEFLPDGNVARAEDALRAGPLPWTILRPSHFAQNFTEAMFTPVFSGLTDASAGSTARDVVTAPAGDVVTAPLTGLVTAPVGDGAEPFVDVLDIAEAAARVLVTGDADGEIVALSGPAALTFDEAARVLSDVTGQRVRFRDQPLADHADQLRAAGTPEEYIRWRLAMLGGIRRGDDAYLSDGVQRLLGRPATSFAAWARREAASSAWAARG